MEIVDWAWETVLEEAIWVDWRADVFEGLRVRWNGH